MKQEVVIMASIERKTWSRRQVLGAARLAVAPLLRRLMHGVR